MTSDFILTVDIPPTPAPLLRRGLPDGVTMTFKPMKMERSFDVSISFDFDIKVTVDLGLISASAVAGWFVTKFCRAKIDIRPRINGKALPPNDATAVKMITDAIDEKKHKHDAEK